MDVDVVWSGVDGSGCCGWRGCVGLWCGWFGVLCVAWLRRDVWGDVARAWLWAVVCGRGSQVGRRRGASKGRTTHDEAATTHVTQVGGRIPSSRVWRRGERLAASRVAGDAGDRRLTARGRIARRAAAARWRCRGGDDVVECLSGCALVAARRAVPRSRVRSVPFFFLTPGPEWCCGVVPTAGVIGPSVHRVASPSVATVAL